MIESNIRKLDKDEVQEFNNDLAKGKYEYSGSNTGEYTGDGDGKDDDSVFVDETTGNCTRRQVVVVDEKRNIRFDYYDKVK